MNEKKYVGSGKRVGNYDLINFTISAEKIQDAFVEYNGKKWLKLSIGKKKTVDQYGKTHSVWIDEYVPENKQAQATASSLPTPDLPF